MVLRGSILEMALNSNDMAKSNIMGLHELKNKPHVNHFDQSYRHCFTAKSGEILPVYFNMLFPGDKIKINADSLTRTTPLDTAAFTRIRENYQFFAVRLSSLWRFFPDTYKNMPHDLFGNSTSRSAQDALNQITLSTAMPYFNNIQLRNAVTKLYNACSVNTDGNHLSTLQDVYDIIYQHEDPDSPNADQANRRRNSVYAYLNNVYTHEITNGDDDNSDTINEGWNFINLRNGTVRYQNAAKLLSMLGYGDFTPFYTDDLFFNFGELQPNPNNSIGLSVFPLLAYHKICQDHYKFRQWQSYVPQICNIDYVKPNDS